MIFSQCKKCGSQVWAHFPKGSASSVATVSFYSSDVPLCEKCIGTISVSHTRIGKKKVKKFTPWHRVVK